MPKCYRRAPAESSIAQCSGQRECDFRAKSLEMELAFLRLAERSCLPINWRGQQACMGTHMESWLLRHRITVDDYHRMVEVGLLAEDARVELIEGEIIDMAPIGSRHDAVVSRLHELLYEAAARRAIVRSQSSLRLSRSSQPQPDLTFVKRRSDFYAVVHPAPADVFLVIEVSDSTMRYDREVKVPLYARHAVPEVWLVDLMARRIHFFRSPGDGNYTDVSSTGEPGVTAIATLPDVAIDLSGVLPAAN